jgi:ABC-type Mn2+/Zn2+ transport system permease subunit
MGIGVVTAVGGLLASYGLDVPSGATIILAQAVLFLMALARAQR